MLALWRKTFWDAAWPLGWNALLLLTFSWLFVWLMAQIQIPAFMAFLSHLPDFFERLAGMPFAAVATPAGKISLLFVDAVTILVCVSWAVARGSDAVSGELGRGTMELLLAQPLRRSTVLLVQAAITTLGSALLAASVLLGLWLGLETVHAEAELPLAQFIPSTLNLFGMMFCVAGYTTAISACDRERWRTIGFAAGVFVVSLVIKLISRTWPAGKWLLYLSFLGAFEPHNLVTQPDDVWNTVGRYLAVHLTLGTVGYAAALVIFTRRDLPAPL